SIRKEEGPVRGSAGRAKQVVQGAAATPNITTLAIVQAGGTFLFLEPLSYPRLLNQVSWRLVRRLQPPLEVPYEDAMLDGGLLHHLDGEDPRQRSLRGPLVIPKGAKALGNSIVEALRSDVD